VIYNELCETILGTISWLIQKELLDRPARVLGPLAPKLLPIRGRLSIPHLDRPERRAVLG
jgi:hypothetical protein